jgi:stage II sporulation protein AA (anti-sigma F factor antagonist)
VIAPTPAVRRVLDLTGVSITVPISESVEDALALIDKGREDAEEAETPQA